jgi:hypothetical protein
MKTPDDGSGLPPAVLQKLTEIRGEQRRVQLHTSAARAAAILLTAILTAMTIDWLLVLHDNHWRRALTLLALAVAAAAFGRFCVLPLFRKRSLQSIARDIDAANPSLEERFLTLTGLAQSKDATEFRGSEEMLAQVAEQTANMSGRVSASSVVSRSGLIAARQYLGIVTGLFLLLFVVNFQQSKILFERFWSPNSDLTMTRIAAKPGDIVIGKGDDVTLDFTATGKIPKVADLDIRSAKRHDVIPLEQAPGKNGSFEYALNSVNNSFDYRARAGDGETAWHHVTVTERPKISQVKMRIIPPAYSKLPVVEQDALPRQVRALEGSQLEVSFKSDQPLASMNLKFADGKMLAVAESPDHTYRFATLLTNTLAFTPILTNEQHLDNSQKPTAEVSVYPDMPPTVTVQTPENEITARHDDKVKINFEARDDFGIAKADLVVKVKDGTKTSTTVMPIPLGKDEAGAKIVRKEMALDLSKFNLKQDQELTYAVRVTDTKENPAQSSSAQKSQTAQNSSNKTPENKTPPPDTQKHIAAKNPPAKPPSKPGDGAKPSPNNLSKRMLDVAQSCSCQPMKITVNDWGKSFEAQRREKLEIAIDPVLRSLDESLGKAQDSTESTLAAGRSAGLSEKQGPAVSGARANLRQADSAVSDLKKISAGTPYAFISLQIDDVRNDHISPARKNLRDVTLESASAKGDLANLDQGDYQIKRAREKLANLTKTYEEVKRDNKLAEAMQRLSKMHQIFIEDTQAMLGSSPPPLNPQQRKIAEVSDDFAEKFRKMLEEKKNIMAELAKILASDPRLLRRYMALEELNGRTLRDQMTLLARRQQALAQQSGQWNAASAKDRPGFLNEQIAAQSSEQAAISQQTSKLLEDMMTWAPLDVPVDKEPIAGCRKLAADAAQIASEAAKQTTPETINTGLATASNALEKLRDLQAALPGLDWIVGSKEKVSAFEANRLNDTADLITRQSGWIKKMEALRAGQYAQAAEVDQHRLMLDTATLSDKLDTTAASVAGMSDEIKAKASELAATMHDQILKEESGATTAFGRDAVPEAAKHQVWATNAFARGERRFDELLHLIIAKLDAEPPPSQVGEPPGMKDILAMLEDEKKACEKLGIPCRPINIQVAKDWMKPGSCSNPGSGQGRAAQAQASQARAKTLKASEQAKNLVVKAVKALPASERKANATGPRPAAKGWNTLASQLGDELRQGRDTVPPEQYRQAIEQYFSTIAEKPAENQGAASH